MNIQYNLALVALRIIEKYCGIDRAFCKESLKERECVNTN